MSTPISPVVIEGLVFEGEFPVRWVFLSTEPSLLDEVHANQQNRQLLSVMLASEAHVHEGEEEAEVLSHELQRIEGKLNLLLDLVGRLLCETNQLPTRYQVYLGGSALQCRLPADFALPPGDTSKALIKIEIFINPQMPMPLILHAEGKLIDAEDGEKYLLASYFGLEQETQDLLEKFIFQQHRRLIAQSRRSK